MKRAALVILLCGVARADSFDDFKRRLASEARPKCAAGSAWWCDQLGISTDDEDERRRAFEKGCDGGWGASCYSLSLKLHASDPKRARKLLQRGCTLGNPNACEDERHDLAAEGARPRLERECAAGRAPSCHDLAQLTDANMRPLLDEKRRAELEARACKAEVGAACFELGKKLRGAAKLDAWSRACKRGTADACLSLAIDRQYGGDEIEEDRTDAARLYRAACDGGRAQGCHSLGQMLAAGDGLPADRARARELYLRACAGGFADACAGMVYHAGDFTRFDDARDGLERLRARCAADRVECMELNAAVKDLRGDAAVVARLEAACAKKEPAACRARELLDAPPP